MAAPRLAAPPARITQEGRRDAAAKSAASPLATVARRPPDVTARLIVSDRTAALSSLTTIVTRLGGTEVARRAERGAHVIDITLPLESYGAFTRQASQLGNFTAEHEAELPQTITMSVHVTD